MTSALPTIFLDLASDVELPIEIGDAENFFTRLAQYTLAHLNLSGFYELSIVITDAERIRHINNTFRGVDNATDVLSFPLSDAPLLALSQFESWTVHEFGDDTHRDPITRADRASVPSTYQPSPLQPQSLGSPDIAYALGDIMISMPVVYEQAIQTQQQPLHELAFLTIHGILHLVGYDDYYEPGYHAMIFHQEAVLARCNPTEQSK